MKPLPSLLSALALAAGLLAALPAHAVGRLIDVDVIDRDSGAALPVVRHNGEWWVAGRPGARYAIQVRNATAGRVLGVMSVDGVNIVSGDTAAWDQTGYVLHRGQNARINGWRKNDDEVAVFHFTALPRSYAARTGRPDNVGVIGVAVFREKLAPPPLPLPRPRYRHDRYEAPAAGEAGGAASPQAAPSARADAAAGADMAAEAEMSARAQVPHMARKPAPAAPRLGTGHGEREADVVSSTAFERRTSAPEEVISIRYDSRENLMAMGILPAHPPVAQRPAAFPDAPQPRYVPDPPAWR